MGIVEMKLMLSNDEKLKTKEAEAFNMKTECCYKAVEGSVYWNPYNRVVQCHHCGHVYTPVSKLNYFINRFKKWWG